MGAVRLQFKKGRDDWEFGLITIMIWLKTGLMAAYEDGTHKLVEYGDFEDLENLHQKLQDGDAILNYSQTLYFIQATDLLSKILINEEENINFIVFTLVCNLTKRFNDLKEFEAYYLDYSSSLIAFIKREFEKEPELRNALEKLIKQ